MTTLDRYIVRSLMTNYVISLAVMMSLYIVLDLFFNIDEFTESVQNVTELLANIGSYYGAHSFLYFGQLSGVITLFACMSTLARMRRANELTAVLASGVSLYRVAVPLLAFGVLTSLLWYVDTEVVIPSIAHRLARSHEDAAGLRSRGVWFVKDKDASLLSALEFIPAKGEMRHVLVLHRDQAGSLLKITEADAATWEEAPAGTSRGQWRLDRGLIRSRAPRRQGLGPREEEAPAPAATLDTRLTPELLELRQAQQWLGFSSSRQLSELEQQEPLLAPRIRHIKHGRFATPLVHVLMLMLGLPIFLSREPANVVTDAGKCVVLCGACFLLAFAGENFVRTQVYSALPAWLPLILFTPIAVVLNDRIRT